MSISSANCLNKQSSIHDDSEKDHGGHGDSNGPSSSSSSNEITLNLDSSGDDVPLNSNDDIANKDILRSVAIAEVVSTPELTSELSPELTPELTPEAVPETSKTLKKKVIYVFILNLPTGKQCLVNLNKNLEILIR